MRPAVLSAIIVLALTGLASQVTNLKSADHRKFDIDSLLNGRFGSRAWIAAHLGAAGGTVTSKARTAAARANGKIGGRPRKSVAS